MCRDAVLVLLEVILQNEKQHDEIDEAKSMGPNPSRSVNTEVPTSLCWSYHENIKWFGKVHYVRNR